MAMRAGSGKITWSDARHIKDGKIYDLSGDSLERQAILFGIAHFLEACSSWTDKSNHGDMIGN